MPMVTFLPEGVSVEVEEGTNLLQAAQDNNITIQTTCGGKAQCRECIVQVVEDDDALTPLCRAEEKLLGNVYFITKERLSCQTQVLKSGAIVTVPPPRPRPKRAPRRPRFPKKR